MSKKFTFWVEEYLFHPSSFLQYTLLIFLLPFSLIYTLIVVSKRIYAQPLIPRIPVISIGNLTVGGSGKTPFLIALASDFQNIAIILRGYKRESTGLHVVDLCTNIKISGDEAMLYVNALPNAKVIVSENRLKAINYACKLGCKVAFLDDGFSKSYIKKFDILIKPNPEPKLNFTLPSGAYREPKSFYKYANLIVKEDIDFKRVVNIENKTERMILITGISKPQRLDKYLPKNVIEKVYFADHYMYSKKELENIFINSGATSILTTTKDAVKMKGFNFPLSIMTLHVEIHDNIKKKINEYLVNFR